ncbi:MAG: ATP-binding protein [Burkholderiales bacterium]
MVLQHTDVETGWRFLLRALVLLAALALATLARASEVVGPTPKQTLAQTHILILSPATLGGIRSADQYAQRLLEALKTSGVDNARIHFEFLDLTRSPDPVYRQRLANLLEEKYRKVRMNLVFTLGQPSMDFLFNEGRHLAPDAILFGWLARIPPQANTAGRRIILQSPKINVAGTLDLAFKLFPKTERLLIVRGIGSLEGVYDPYLKEALRPWQGKVAIEDTRDLDGDAMVERVRYLPERTLILFFIVSKDAQGRTLVSAEVGDQILRNSNRPVFTIWGVQTGVDGGVGGDVVRVEEDAAQFGKKAVDVLTGVTPLAPGVSLEEGGTTPVLDWTQLQRWGADLRHLPANTIMLNQPPPLWAVYRTTVIWTAAIFALVVLSALWLVFLNRRLVRARSDLVALNANLDQHVTTRTSELSTALEHLKHTQNELIQSEKLASLGAMVAGVSHELNTPIGNALTVATALAEETSRLENHMREGTLRKSDLIAGLGSAHEMANLVGRAMKQAAVLIESFKQVAVDQTSERRREFDLRATVEDVVCALRPSLHGWPVVIVNEVPSGLICDSFPGPLGQIVTNLVQNACLHAFCGCEGGTVTLSVPVGSSESTIQLAVTDDGLGMDSVTLAHIFDPFFTTKLGKGGSGLGLSVCHRIATTILAGELAVVSTPGLGSCFTLTFRVRAPGKM